MTCVFACVDTWGSEQCNRARGSPEGLFPARWARESSGEFSANWHDQHSGGKCNREGDRPSPQPYEQKIIDETDIDCGHGKGHDETHAEGNDQAHQQAGVFWVNHSCDMSSE